MLKVYRDNASAITTRRNLLDDMDTIDEYDLAEEEQHEAQEVAERADIVDQITSSVLRPSTIIRFPNHTYRVNTCISPHNLHHYNRE